MTTTAPTASACCSATASGRRSSPPPCASWTPRSPPSGAAAGRLGASSRWGSRPSRSTAAPSRPPPSRRSPRPTAGCSGRIDGAAYPEPHRSQLNPSGALRKHFDLYANIRPARAFAAGRAVVARRRPGDRAGEHRGLLRRPQHLRGDGRVHADGGRGGHAWASSPGPASSGSPVAAFELARRRRKHADDRAQGQRAAAEHGPVPGRLPRGRPSAIPTSRSTTSTSTP